MRNLIWRPSALDRLDSLIGYIAERDKAAAEKLESMIHHHARMIVTAPLGGRAGRVTGTREWIVHPNYILIYRVTRNSVTILRVLHARQRYP